MKTSSYHYIDSRDEETKFSRLSSFYHWNTDTRKYGLRTFHYSYIAVLIPQTNAPHYSLMYARYRMCFVKLKFDQRSILLLEWTCYYIHYEVWDELIPPSPNFNSYTIEVWEWISKFIPTLLGIWYLRTRRYVSLYSEAIISKPVTFITSLFGSMLPRWPLTCLANFNIFPGFRSTFILRPIDQAYK